jgi:hypothetical protein
MQAFERKWEGISLKFTIGFMLSKLTLATERGSYCS